MAEKKKCYERLNIVNVVVSTSLEHDVPLEKMAATLSNTEYNPAHTNRNLYSGMTDEYYGKPFHPTQALHQYDCVVGHSDKVFYFGGIKPSEQKHFEKLLTRYNKKVMYLD